MLLNASEKTRAHDLLNSGTSLQRASRSTNGQLAYASYDDNPDHILWGGVEGCSSSVSHEDSSLDLGMKLKDCLRENVILMVDNTNSSGERTYEPVREDANLDNLVSLQKPVVQPNDPTQPDSHRLLDDTFQKSPDPQRKELAKQSLIDKGVDIDELLARVPFDENGEPTSIGSIGHHSLMCQEVCAFMKFPGGCAKEIFCGACHFAHGAPKKKAKDGKSKRDRYRRLKEDLKRQVEEDPLDFKFSSNDLPPWIAKDGRLTGKLLNSLRTHHDEVKKELIDL